MPNVLHIMLFLEICILLQHASLCNPDYKRMIWTELIEEKYEGGDVCNLSEAEGCSIQHTETAEFCIEPLLLCCSTHGSWKDCKMAAALDPNFVKANLRSANCFINEFVKTTLKKELYNEN